MRQYTKGKRVTSIAEFERLVNYGQELFIIGWGKDGYTRHIGFIQSLQYYFLKTRIIDGVGLWVAKKIEKKERNKNGNKE